MARKSRIEYPGACYHVINRGNYRGWVFEEVGAAESFRQALFEACERSGWVLHAFVVMGNHFHLALETPKGNLVAGMQWLQSTFSTRFNRYRKESGHVFQGRYKALLVEPGEALGRVCHYIHLNPVRAGIVPVERLSEHTLSSYRYLRLKQERPAFLQVQTALLQAGNLSDDERGWSAYEGYLAWQDAQGPAGRSAAYEKLSKGWAIGSPVFREELLQRYKDCIDLRTWDNEGARQAREELWKSALVELMGKLGAPKPGSAKSDPLRVALAVALKLRTDAGNGWIASQLEMGEAAYVGKLVCALRRRREGQAWFLLKRYGIAEGMA